MKASRIEFIDIWNCQRTIYTLCVCVASSHHLLGFSTLNSHSPGIFLSFFFQVNTKFNSAHKEGNNSNVPKHQVSLFNTDVYFLHILYSQTCIHTHMHTVHVYWKSFFNVQPAINLSYINRFWINFLLLWHKIW